MNQPLDQKYSRQMLFPPIGPEGQERLVSASAILVGCGAIGAATANLLVRSGIGRLRVIDRDFVETSNLQRQTLFDEADAREALPKALAAERKLKSINSDAQVEGLVADLNPRNVNELLSGFPLILDGTDNFETRFLINDFAVNGGIPWIYAAAVSSYGLTMVIRPGRTACLACFLEASAPTGLDETCDTVGVLGSVVSLIASLQVTEAIKFLAGRHDALHGRLLSFDVWSGRCQSIEPRRNPACQVCSRHEFSHLTGVAQPHITMCGRDSVQIHECNRALDLQELETRLAPAVSDVRQNGYLLRFRVPPYEMTVFADGRAILKGTTDPTIARSLYAKYIGG